MTTDKDQSEIVKNSRPVRRYVRIVARNLGGGVALGQKQDPKIQPPGMVAMETPPSADGRDGHPDGRVAALALAGNPAEFGRKSRCGIS
jgi:hypothetical protein